MKEFRVLTYMDTTMEVTNQRVAVFELGEVEYLEINFGSGKLPLSRMHGPSFVTNHNSNIARKILHSFHKEEIVQIDLSEFKSRNEIKNGREEEIWYHKNVHLPLTNELPNFLTWLKKYFN